MTRIVNNTTYLKLLNEELEARVSSCSQYFINLRLTWAVFCMIGVILFAFASMLYLGLKKESALVTLVKHRVAIEVIGLGFLLLTIIILGSGKLLAPEGTAALLGTIAGYIFVRKANDLAELSADSESNPPPRGKNGDPNGGNPEDGKPDPDADDADTGDEQGDAEADSENGDSDDESVDQPGQDSDDGDGADQGQTDEATNVEQAEPQTTETDDAEPEESPRPKRKRKTVRKKATNG